MTTRIDRRFETLKAEDRPALVTYFMGGDPDYDTSLRIMQGLPRAGAEPEGAEGRADAEEDAGHGRAIPPRRQ